MTTEMPKQSAGQKRSFRRVLPYVVGCLVLAATVATWIALQRLHEERLTRQREASLQLVESQLRAEQARAAAQPVPAPPNVPLSGIERARRARPPAPAALPVPSVVGAGVVEPSKAHSSKPIRFPLIKANEANGP